MADGQNTRKIIASIPTIVKVVKRIIDAIKRRRDEKR